MEANRGRKIIRGLIMILSVLCVVMLCTFAVLKGRKPGKKEIEECQRHYAFIAEEMDETAAEWVFREAQRRGEETGAYVENFRENATSDYDCRDYLRMAIEMEVDGIILKGNGEKEVQELVDEAAKKGIPTITFHEDIQESKRKCFIDIGGFNMGRSYARQIIEIATKETKQVMVISEKESEGETHNWKYSMLSGIEETLKNEGNHLNLELLIKESEGGMYGTSTLVNNYLNDEETANPDIIICLNESDTLDVYNVLKGCGLQDQIKVIGYCASRLIMNLVQEQAIVAAIEVDARQAGISCVDVLDEYIRTGQVKGYITVDTNAITEKNVKRYLEYVEEEKE